MNRRQKTIVPVVAAICAAAVGFVWTATRPNVRTASETEQRALRMAQVAEDVRLTGELCREQCRRHVRQAAEEASSSPEPIKTLQEWHIRRDDLPLLLWVPETGGENVRIGELDGRLADVVAPLLDEAGQALRQGRPYASPTVFDRNGDSYFVLAEPSGRRGGGLIAVSRQKIMSEIYRRQLRHLRLDPPPAPGDRRWKPQGSRPDSHYKTDELVVKFRRTPSATDLNRFRLEAGAQVVHQTGRIFVFRSDRLGAEKLRDYFLKTEIEYAEPHYLYETNEVVPNDSLYLRYQWNLPQIAADRGWDISKGSDDVLVAVVDTGVDRDHPDLNGRIRPGRNTIRPDAPPLDDVGHGTHVAGIISAIVNNATGIAGMSWNNPILPVKALDDTGAGSTLSVAQGIIWATDQGAKVINLSLGNYADSDFLHDAVRYAYERDVVLVAAVGNDNTDKPGYPAAYPEVLAVGATGPNRKKAAFSNYGDYLDVVAPGIGIASTYPNGRYAAMSGTSMASPHVAALAALIRSVNPRLTNAEVYDIIRRTADDLGPKGRDPYFGYGEINAQKALEEAVGRTAAPPASWAEWFARWLERLTQIF
ncbi:MAG: hypothetical protein BLM47_07895 [Candidatus Reconcilbacillus cellulovorans]|uniref:Peptidase S8/S53 domain-containing protein n=1 Tax=Candidatus Reconcilbacillus cellulovorans TaxID=1906605 RepID=A0A2A6E009_9BACL|nr:MAG: hypothetical protein BLM47_07895 [Candidatus Reconcilbacillus cellulovorans]